MDLPNAPCKSNTVRSSNGCWICRLRRKKCDEKHPVCGICDALGITCHYGQDKPEWMDSGSRQEEMAERLKREIKQKGHRRRSSRGVHLSGDRVLNIEATTGESTVLPQRPSRDMSTSRCNLLKATSDSHNNGMEPCPEVSLSSFQHGFRCTLACKEAREGMTLKQPDMVLLIFYLEYLFPFLFPFYCPSLLVRGGRGWLLEMMTNSPVVRYASLCQSSYFLSLARDTGGRDIVCEKSRDAFGMLRQSLQVIDGSNLTEHLHGAVRILVSIMQVQRFEIVVLSFDSCKMHLSAGLALFSQILDNANVAETTELGSRFNAVMRRLGPSWSLPTQCSHIPSVEQAAFRFSSALLILDDIIASTVLQQQPRLYEYHHSLLGGTDDTDPAVDLEAVVGCQNWALLQIGEIAVLDSWKQECTKASSLDVMELVRRATNIKDALEAHLARLDTEPVAIPEGGSLLLDVLTANQGQASLTPSSQTPTVTRVWAHAALIYLFVVVSGWQPASVDVRYHVSRVVELLKCQISPPGLLRTMVWPFCVAGCLAESAQEAHLRGMAEALQPPSVFGTVHKALDIMQKVWRNRDAGDAAIHDLATCFRSQDGLVLLV